MGSKTKRERIQSWGRRTRTVCLIACVAGVCLGSVPSFATAQTIVVNTLTDKADPPFNTDSFCGSGTIANLPAVHSLREAIIAANNTPGPQTITFAPGLSGGTINVTFDNLDAGTDPNPLPGLCGSDTTINGDINGDGVPDITLNGAALPVGADGFTIASSRNTIRGLWLKDFPDGGIGIFHAQGLVSSAAQISDNTLQGNIVEGTTFALFVQAGFPGFPGHVKNSSVLGNRVSGATQGIVVFTRDAAGSSIDSTTIVGNSSSLSQIGIHLLASTSATGSNTSITHANVTDNIVSDNSLFGIEVQAFAGDNNTLTGITLARNTVANNRVGILALGGNTASNANLLKVSIKDNTVRGGNFPTGTAGIIVEGGFNSSINNQVEASILRNVVKDNTGSGISAAVGQDDSSNNSVTATISNNTVERNTGDGITASGGIGASFFATGTSNNNTLDVAITGNTVKDHPRQGISVAGGVGSRDGRAGAIANNNRVTAMVNNNIVRDSDTIGIGIAGAGSGLANANQVNAQVTKNQACNSGMLDLGVAGGFPGDAFFPPTVGVNNVAQVQATKNTMTTIAAANGVVGNFATLTQTNNVPCP